MLKVGMVRRISEICGEIIKETMGGSHFKLVNEFCLGHHLRRISISVLTIMSSKNADVPI